MVLIFMLPLVGESGQPQMLPLLQPHSLLPPPCYGVVSRLCSPHQCCVQLGWTNLLQSGTTQDTGTDGQRFDLGVRSHWFLRFRLHITHSRDRIKLAFQMVTLPCGHYWGHRSLLLPSVVLSPVCQTLSTLCGPPQRVDTGT